MRCFGDIDINEFTTGSLKEYLVEKGDYLNPSSLGHRIRFLKSIFNWAHGEGVILKNPATKIKEPKLGERIQKISFWTRNWIIAGILSYFYGKGIIEFMYSTGCRIGEVIKLNREDINVHSQSVVVHGKGDKEREVYFNVRCDLWLKRYLVKE